MSEWWTYRLQDFLLFSPRVYWRMFELHNEAVWPLHIPALLLGSAILVWLARPRPWSGMAASLILAAAWSWVAWSFLWDRYSTINWAVAYAVPAFTVEALLLAWMGFRGRFRLQGEWNIRGVGGAALLVYAVTLHPLVAKLAGRPIGAAEVFGISPDPTVIATLGFLSIAFAGGTAWLLSIVPLAWCAASWATLDTMGAPEAWIPLTAAGIAVGARVWPRPGKRTRLVK